MFRKSVIIKIKKYWLENTWLGAILILIITAGLVTFLIASPTFTDPDSFYHLKMSELMMKKRTAITEFPWLQFTILKDSYVDHHLLYHVFLIPFMLFFGSIVGIKFATVILAASALTLFFLFLKSLHIRYSFWFTLLLLFSSPFTFRISLSKAPSVGFLLLIAGFILLARKNYKLLPLLGFIYVWSYGGFLLMLVLTVIFGLSQLIIYRRDHKKYPHKKEFFQFLAPFFLSFTGITAGLLIHPSFPNHFKFYWQQIIQVGLINYSDQIGVGGEWYPSPLSVLVTGPIILSSLLVVSLVAFFLYWRKQNVLTLTSFLMMVIFFFYTLKSRRYVEYYLPWGFIFCALTLTRSNFLDIFHHLITKMPHKKLQNWLERVIVGMTCLYFLIFVPGIIISEGRRVYDDLHNGLPIKRFSAAGDWLRDHSTNGDIVFHDDWDNFPLLFYNVTKVRYITGLDSTFMYAADPELYDKWAKITKGEKKDNLLEIIGGDFRARFVFVDSDHQDLRTNIESDGRFDLVYKDEEAVIFRVPRK